MIRVRHDRVPDLGGATAMDESGVTRDPSARDRPKKIAGEVYRRKAGRALGKMCNAAPTASRVGQCDHGRCMAA